MGDNPSKFKEPKRLIESIDYSSIEQFLARLSELVPGLDLSLPLKAQWEYACRAGYNAATYANPAESLSDIAWFDENSEQQTQPVGMKRCNAWGLHDMLGNVREWCADHWHGNYEGAPNDGSAWLSDDAAAARVGRGGSWGLLAWFVRAAFRYLIPPTDRDDYPGFRCVECAEALGHSLTKRRSSWCPP